MKPITHILCDIPGRVKRGGVLRRRGARDLDPEEDAREEVDGEHGDEEEPGDLERCGSEIDDTIVLHDPASEVTTFQRERGTDGEGGGGRGRKRGVASWTKFRLESGWGRSIRKFAARRSREGQPHSLDHFDRLEDAHDLEDAESLDDPQDPRLAVQLPA